MTDNDLLRLYDEIAEDVDDSILDEADELFNIGISTGETLSIPVDYYIWVARTHMERTVDKVD